MSTNWNECFVTDNIDVVCKSWTEKLLSLARAFIPSKKVLLRPMISHGITIIFDY